MDSIRLLIIDDNELLVKMIDDYFKGNQNIKINLTAKNGKEGIEQIENNQEDFDVLLLDIVMPEKDGIDVLEYMKKNAIDKRVIVMTAYNSSDMIHRIAYLGADYIIIKPFEIKVLEEKIMYIIDRNYLNDNMMDLFHYDLQRTIIHILHELGVPSHIQGYEYIKEGILSVYKNNVSTASKEIYQRIAIKYDSTISRVERSIRHAIETSWNRGNWDLMEELFGNSIDSEKAKPTNSEYIMTIAEKLKIDFYK